MKLIKTIIAFSLFGLFTFSATTANGQGTEGHIPFYAEPYYNYDPLKITIGKYKKELLTNDTSKLTILANNIKADINNTDIESLYFLSIRLYDLGKKDDAFYWFQTAKSRARIFMNMLDPKKIGSIGDETFELKQLFIAFNQIVGEYLNGYGFNDIDKGLAVFEKVKSEVKDIQSYKDVYKKVRFLDDKNLETEKANKEKELAQTIDYVKTNREEIKKQRIDNGIQDKY
jgi:hypothetical protein